MSEYQDEWTSIQLLGRTWVAAAEASKSLYLARKAARSSEERVTEYRKTVENLEHRLLRGHALHRNLEHRLKLAQDSYKVAMEAWDRSFKAEGELRRELKQKRSDVLFSAAVDFARRGL